MTEADVPGSERKDSPVTPMFRNKDNDRLAGKGRSSVCKSRVMNLGNNPRVLGAEECGESPTVPRDGEGDTAAVSSHLDVAW